MNREPLFSVVITTCNRLEMLAKCLDRLGCGMQSLAANQYEVIVTDDGSQSTAEQLMKGKYPWARWLQGPRKGPAANRNNGARYAEGEWLVFTDDDCCAVHREILFAGGGAGAGIFRYTGTL